MTKAVSILVPDNLLPVLTTFLDSASDMRETMAAGLLKLSADMDAEGDVVLAPSLESALQWGYNRDIHWPMAVAHASALLAQVAEISARSDVAVIREQDLELRPNRVLQTIADRIEFSRGIEVEPPHVAKPRPIVSDNMPLKVSPLRIYGEIPVPNGMWAFWPSYLFWTYNGACPASIEVTGRSRLLFFGPFVALSPGTWRADLVFELTDEAVPYDYYIEIGGADKFERRIFRAEKAGQQIVRMRYTAVDRRHVEIKVGLLRAAFHGELKLTGAWIVKIE